MSRPDEYEFKPPHISRGSHKKQKALPLGGGGGGVIVAEAAPELRGDYFRMARYCGFARGLEGWEAKPWPELTEGERAAYMAAYEEGRGARGGRGVMNPYKLNGPE